MVIADGKDNDCDDQIDEELCRPSGIGSLLDYMPF